MEFVSSPSSSSSSFSFILIIIIVQPWACFLLLAEGVLLSTEQLHQKCRHCPRNPRFLKDQVVLSHPGFGKLSVKGPKANIFGFADHVISVATIQPSTQATIYKISMKGRGCVPKTLYRSRQEARFGCGLPTLGTASFPIILQPTVNSLLTSAPLQGLWNYLQWSLCHKIQRLIS